jgi:2,3-bisphosphoglycerate-dependent phosphoglycerate mutase
MQIFLIRHGKPKVLNNSFYEAHLSEEAIIQVRQLALSGKLQKPDRVFSSPYNRAIDTTRAICDVFKVDFEVKDFLREWDLQSLNLLDPEYSVQTENGWADDKLRVQGGESLEEVRQRAYDGIMETASSVTVNTIFFVCHGTLMEMLCSKIGRRDADRSNVESMKFLEYALFEFRDGVLRLKKDNNTH